MKKLFRISVLAIAVLTLASTTALAVPIGGDPPPQAGILSTVVSIVLSIIV